MRHVTPDSHALEKPKHAQPPTPTWIWFTGGQQRVAWSASASDQRRQTDEHMRASGPGRIKWTQPVYNRVTISHIAEFTEQFTPTHSSLMSPTNHCQGNQVGALMQNPVRSARYYVPPSPSSILFLQFRCPGDSRCNPFSTMFFPPQQFLSSFPLPGYFLSL
jgi:hypothetical protein